MDKPTKASQERQFQVMLTAIMEEHKIGAITADEAKMKIGAAKLMCGIAPTPDTEDQNGQANVQPDRG